MDNGGGLTPLPASLVSTPLIKECYANIECRVVDYIKQHDIFVLDGIKAWIDEERREKMGDKLPPGV